MAMANKEKYYLRITAVHVQRRQVDVDIWESKVKRQEGESVFVKPHKRSYQCGKAFEEKMAAKADSKKSIADNVTAAAYRALKTMGEVRNEFSKDV